MFIYKITVGKKVYIGFDSKPEYKEHRWKAHCKIAKYYKGEKKTKLHSAMKKHGIENCMYEVIETGFSRIIDLALAEIKYIKEHDSYRKGLNSTPGGDGLGKHSLDKMTVEEIDQLKISLGEHWTKWNKKRWGALSVDERKEQTAHLHTQEVYAKKSETLKKFYKANPDEKKKKGEGIKKWQIANKEKHKSIVKVNGLKGAEKTSKKVVTEWENGRIEVFKSRSDFQRQTGLWFSTLVAKSKQGLYYKGYRLKDSND